MSQNLIHPTDVPVAHTLRFLLDALPAPGLRVLEVGCGKGAVAARLKAQGLHVTALDTSAEAVAAARERGVEAIEADFLAFAGDPYDAVVFTRSLHHLQSLEGALERAHQLLRPNGVLVLEEFAIERMDGATARWFFDLRALLEAAALMPVAPALEPPPRDTLERWFREHDGEEPIHPGAEMLAELGRRFETLQRVDAPCLYRHVCDRIEASERGLQVAQQVFEIESRRVAEGSLQPLGLRVVARRRD
ncbi:MAG TPA: class I SAM-dependent methyltransferase [Candidatus Limnocylindria bacterium]|nr:class I SAM-dependent methyltransferase [Candidatus Limnocylindria bacterium]